MRRVLSFAGRFSCPACIYGREAEVAVSNERYFFRTHLQSNCITQSTLGRLNSIPGFIRLEKTAEGMTEVYTRTVRYSDLDKSNHMTNLRYIDMFQDAYDKAFWNQFDARQMEICFLSQSREGESLSVRSRQNGHELSFAAVHTDGTLAAIAMFK